jgi:phosphate/sulfate permease
MKFVAIALLAFVATAIAGPVSISDNNIGDIVTVGVNANAQLSNSIDQDIVNVIVALLNQQAVVVAPSADTAAAPVETLKLPEITPAMVEKVKALLN